MPNSSPVEAIIGLGLDVKGAGFDRVNKYLDDHAQGWEKASHSVERIGTHVDSLIGRIGQLAGLVGIGGLLTDFVRLETAANRVALAMGSVTGTAGGYQGLRSQVMGAAAGTGQDPSQMFGALGALQSRVGGSYLQRPGAVGNVTRALGSYAGAFGMSPQDVAAQIGSVELFQRQNLGSTPMLMREIASQAAQAGMAGQTSLFTQTISSLVSSLVSQTPSIAGPGANLRIGAMYGAATQANQAFRDPSTFAAGVQGLNAGFQGAYANPSLAAAMQMAGIGYWEQRQGLGGPHGPDMAKKLLSYTDMMFGRGSIMQDVFLRSNFGGNVSSDLLKSIAEGKGPQRMKQLMHAGTSPDALGGAQSDIEKRLRQYMTTPEAQIQRARGGLENQLLGAIEGPLGSVLGFAADNPMLALAALFPGRWALKAGINRGTGALGSALAKRFGSRAAGRAAEEAIAQAGGRTGTTALEDVIAEQLAGRGGSAAAGEAGSGLLGGIGGGTLGGLALGTVGAYAGLMLFPDSTQPFGAEKRGLHAAIDRQALHNALAGAEAARKRYGPHWMQDPKALEYAKKRSDFLSRYMGRDQHLGAQDLTRLSHGELPFGYEDPHKRHSADPRSLGDLKFSHAVDKFAVYVQRMLGGQVGPQKTAFDQQGAGLGFMNAAGIHGGSDMIGSNMVLARAISLGGRANMQQASALGVPSGLSGGTQTAAAHGATAAGNTSGWQSCTLTWYQPSAGGINGRSGGGAWSGHPVYDSTWGCAAPPQYAFGTNITFAYQGKQVTVPVVDRGGAIQGAHFDLLPGPAAALGMQSAGVVQAVFTVGGGGGGTAAAGTASAMHVTRRGGAGGAGGGASGPLQAASAWMRGGGGGSPAQPANQKGHVINVNVDGRKIETYQAITNGRV